MLMLIGWHLIGHIHHVSSVNSVKFLDQPASEEPAAYIYMHGAVWLFAILQLNQHEPLIPCSWFCFTMNKTENKMFFFHLSCTKLIH